jgi:hypothetical protein
MSINTVNNALTGTLYAKLPMEMVGNIYSYCNPVIEATNDIVNSEEFKLMTDKIRLRKFVVAIIKRMNRYYGVNLTIDDVEDYYIEDDDGNENYDEKILGEGHNMEMYFKASAIERERKAQGYSIRLPDTRKFVVFVENYSTHRELLKDYYEDGRMNQFTYEHIKEYFGDHFTMPKYLFKKAMLKMDGDEEHEFILSLVEMMETDRYYTQDFIWETFGDNDEDHHDKKYNAGVYYGMDGETIVLMDCPADMVIEEDGVPEYYIVPTEE